MQVLTDAASRADIQAKLAAVNKQYNALQAKLDQRKAELEGYLRYVKYTEWTLVYVPVKAYFYIFSQRVKNK